MSDPSTSGREASPGDAGNGKAQRQAAASPAGEIRRPDENKFTASLKAENLLLSGAWLLAVSLALLAAYLCWYAWAKPTEPGKTSGVAQAATGGQVAEFPAPASDGSQASMPGFTLSLPADGVLRQAVLHTIIPDRPREDAITYTVTTGDSVFGIATDFSLKPESVLWANYTLLKDNPEMLTLGMVLTIPPTNGVYYQWQEGDTLDGVADRFKTTKEAIIGWPGNHLDLVNPVVKAGDTVMVPGGKREFVQWIIPTIPRGKAGVSKNLLGPGACEGGYGGAIGGGAFLWPSANHKLSGNDYWSGHLGIDIGGAIGDGVFASDSGVVVFAGWAYGGYGNMIMIDHGNGYQTLYAHLSSVRAGCGQSVNRGGYIGAIGSTGNSTGAHLHFEVRLNGGWVNPWHVLPPP